jgi:hypothetical protein
MSVTWRGRRAPRCRGWQDRLAASDVLHHGHTMASLSARIPDPLASRFDAFAATRGGKSRVLRALMEAALEGAMPVAELERARSGRSTKVTLRLKPEDLGQLDEVCADAGLRRTEWIVALVRRRLSGQPRFTPDAAASLLEVRRDLRRLAVNLREMTEASVVEGRCVSASVEALRVEVRQHLQRVREAVAGNLAYWDGDL